MPPGSHTLAWPSVHCSAPRGSRRPSIIAACRFSEVLHHPGIAPACALTIGNFDGVHRGHQAMLALLTNEARHRGLPSCVLTFEPHPRDFFAAQRRQARARAARASRRCATSWPSSSAAASTRWWCCASTRASPRQSPQAFIDDVLVRGLGARYVLVGDDFRFGARRAGDYAMLDAAGAGRGLRRGAHEQLRGARPARVAARRCAPRSPRATWHTPRPARPALQHQRPCDCTAASSGRRARRRLSHAEPAFPPCAAGGDGHLRRARARTGDAAAARRGQPGRAADGRRRRPRAARGALPASGPQSLGADGALRPLRAASSCCTSCTTSASTSRWRRCAQASTRTPPRRATGSRRSPPAGRIGAWHRARTPPPAGRSHAIEFDAAVAARSGAAAAAA